MYAYIFLSLTAMVKEITGSYKIAYPANGPDQPPVIIDFTPPFKRVSMIKGIEDAAGIKIPTDLNSEGISISFVTSPVSFSDDFSLFALLSETRVFLSQVCERFEVKCPEPRTTMRLLDKLVGKFLEDDIVNPTFICDHPEIMSPLAKSYVLRYYSGPLGAILIFDLFLFSFFAVTARRLV